MIVLHIPGDLAEELEAWTKKARLTKSEVARRRLIAAGPHSQDPASGIALIADLIGSIEGGPADMSSRKKEYLKMTGYGKSLHRWRLGPRRLLAEGRSPPTPISRFAAALGGG